MFKWILFFSLPILAADFGSMSHPNRGCPHNSICGPEIGKKKLLWDDLLKNLPKESNLAVKKLEEFRKKNGLLLPVWTLSSSKEEKDIIKWSSPCPQHQNPENKFYQAEVFASDFASLDQNRFIEEEALLLAEKNSVVSYKIPNREIPYYIKGSDLVFNMAFDGIYFQMAVRPSGEIKILKSQKNEFDPIDTQCPKELDLKFEQLGKGLYSDRFCRNIYNISLKKYQTLLFGLTCV